MSQKQSRIITHNPRFDYLPSTDRYVSRKPEAAYRFNVIGTGVNGQEHIRVTEFEGRGTIHGVYDPNPGSVQAAVSILRQSGREPVVYDSLEAACSDPAVDGLIISTPNYSHIDVIPVAARSGKHILLEKPMATTVADAYAILQLSREYPAVFQIGLQYRYKSIFRESIAEVLERKSVGGVRKIAIQEHRIPFLDKVGQWNKFSRYSGGTLVEKCCHYFDLLNHFACSRPVEVYATGSQAVNFIDFTHEGASSDILDNANVLVTYANGVMASFDLCMFAPMFYEELVVCGDDGRLKAWEKKDFISSDALACGIEINPGENRPARYITPHYMKHIEEAGHSGATFIEHLNFIENIEGRATSTADVDDGFWSVVVGAAAELSVRKHRIVRIDELLESCSVDM